jgi:hypothetical protein
MDLSCFYSAFNQAFGMSPYFSDILLVKAHQNLDKAVDLCYRPQPFVNELNRIEFLFSLYETLSAPLLKPEKKKRTRNSKRSTLED